MSDWRDTHSATDTFREDASMGEIGLTAQDNSVTVQIEKTGKGNSLSMGNITRGRVRGQRAAGINSHTKGDSRTHTPSQVSAAVALSVYT